MAAGLIHPATRGVAVTTPVPRADLPRTIIPVFPLTPPTTAEALGLVGWRRGVPPGQIAETTQDAAASLRIEPGSVAVSAKCPGGSGLTTRRPA